MAVERPFDGLEIDGCETRLKGRLDRIDSHPQQGVICWDYKTGRLPRRDEVIDKNNEPQLPAYLLALSKGNVTGALKTEDNFGAGFIELQISGKHETPGLVRSRRTTRRLSKRLGERRRGRAQFNLCRGRVTTLDD